MMRRILFTGAAVLLFGFAQAQEVQSNGTVKEDAQQEPQVSVPASPDTLVIWQMDDTRIHLVGYGNIFISYTETVDGYTIVLNNEGIYEYAERNDKGDLVAGGEKAHDPQDREKSEENYLNRHEKHLRYSGEKLQQLLDKQKKFNESINPKHEK